MRRRLTDDQTGFLKSFTNCRHRNGARAVWCRILFQSGGNIGAKRRGGARIPIAAIHPTTRKNIMISEKGMFCAAFAKQNFSSPTGFSHDQQSGRIARADRFGAVFRVAGLGAF
jgi:hypothetical protein